MYQTRFFHKTPSSTITVNVKLVSLESARLLNYENKCQIEKLCMACPTFGRKWSCPPYSPAFSSLNLDMYPFAVLVLFWCDLDQFSYTKTEYIKIKASNTILKTRMDKFIRSIEQKWGGIMISNGNCRLCNPCNRKKDQACKRPEKMRFSMEALGLNVGGITGDFFNHQLLWYKDKMIPPYLSAAACILTKYNIAEDELENSVLSAL